MLGSEHNNEPVMSPLAPVGQLAHQLTVTTLHCAIGLVIGSLAAIAMRNRGLRWTWAAGALVIVLLARGVLGSATPTLVMATCCATVRGRRWHREDIETGADMVAIATERYGPLDALRSLTHKLVMRRGKTASSSWWHGERLTVGYERAGRPVTIPLGDRTGGMHTLVVGATRSGKTVTMTWLAARAIERGMGSVVIDPKGDRDLRAELRHAALMHGRRFVEWAPWGDTVYNPYARGSETEIADKLLAGERFTEPHYLRQAQRYLGHEVRLLRQAGIEISLKALVEHLDPARLELLTRDLPEVHAGPAYTYLDALTSRQQSDLAGVRDRLAIMAESDIGPWLDPQTPDADRLDLAEAVNTRAVVYFNLRADSRPLLAQMLGAAIVGDLRAAVAGLQGRLVPTLVMIDEFSAISPEHIASLFARAAGVGVSLVLATQELADMRLPGREMLLEQVLGNLSVLIAHRQVVSGSAGLLAEMTETRGVWKTSRHGDGRVTRTRELDHVLRADQVMGLARGWAAVIELSDGGRASIARMLASQRPR